MERIAAIIDAANGWLWGPAMLALLFGTHLFLTVRLSFIQRYIGLAVRLSFRRDSSGSGEISHFGALTTALAATIGTGNIVGVAAAIAVGGPGAVLWMWLTGVFGIATKYGEALLAVRYRVTRPDGTVAGGPMYALEKGLGLKWLAVLFCIFTAIAAFGIGNTVQANSIADLAHETWNVPAWATGVVLTVLTALVILGGIRSIARVCEKLVPVMALLYIAGCVFILVVNARYLGPAFALIVRHAFTPIAAGGGFAGAVVSMTIRKGISRGLFSNESGLGSAPIVAAAARTTNPVRQALVSATGTFWDTVVICALTGMVLVTGILRNPEGMTALDGAKLTRAVFAQVPVVGPWILTLGLLTFVYSTILGWSYYGEKAVEYLFGARAVLPYRLLWVAAVFAGSVASMPLVWNFADASNALMAIPNLLSLLLLSGVIVQQTRHYLAGGNIDRE